MDGAKLGLDCITKADGALIQRFHDIMAAEQLDLTLAFRWLTEIADNSLEHSPVPELFTAPASLIDWSENGKSQAKPRRRRRDHPSARQSDSYPRNHLVQRAIDLAERIA